MRSFVERTGGEYFPKAAFAGDIQTEVLPSMPGLDSTSTPVQTRVARESPERRPLHASALETPPEGSPHRIPSHEPTTVTNRTLCPRAQCPHPPKRIQTQTPEPPAPFDESDSNCNPRTSTRSHPARTTSSRRSHKDHTHHPPSTMDREQLAPPRASHTHRASATSRDTPSHCTHPRKDTHRGPNATSPQGQDHTLERNLAPRTTQ